MDLASASSNWDFFIYTFFFMAVFVYGVAIRKEMSIIMILSTFISVGITTLLTKGGNLQINLSKNFVSIQAILFAVSVFSVSYFLIAHKFLSGMVSEQSEGKAWILERAAFGFSFSGLFIISVINFISEEDKQLLVKKTGPLVQKFLIEEGLGQIFWVFLPFVLLFFTSRGE